MKPVTVRDVANVVGVSASTVSRALTTPAQVAPATRARVAAAARDLGYRPRPATPRPRQRVGTIGLAIPDLGNPHFAAIVKGAQARARALDHRVLIADSDEDPVSERAMYRELAHDVDGLVLCSPRAPLADVREAAHKVPVVLVHRREEDLPSLTVADIDGGRQAAQHLLALGHRRIAWAAGPVQSWTGPRRRSGLQEVIAEVSDAELIDLGPFPATARGGGAAADQVLASGATAVVVFNDLVALGLIERALRRGARIPADLSVVGFDGIAPGEYVTPTLTSVAIDATRIGRTAVDTLLAAIADPDRGRDLAEELPMELVIRNSTAARSGPPTADGHS